MDDVLTIESIQVLNTAGGGQIFGEVMLQFTGYGLQTIYRRTIADPETKLAGDFLTLTASSVEYQCDQWLLYVSLYDGDDQYEIAVGDIHGHIVTMDSLTDQTLSCTMTGRYGAVLIRYNTLSQPVLSNIAVVLLGDEDGAAPVFGTITAHQDLFKEELPTSVILFGKSAGESVPVLSGGAIPMDRCVVGLASGSQITVEVELRRAGTGIGAGDELIASGSVNFKHIYTTYEPEPQPEPEIISGSCGRQVQVSIRFHY